MKKLMIILIVVLLVAFTVVGVAFANPPEPACNGLDVAHAKIHGSGTQGELTLHDLRIANHCAH
jgi:hypothetical protein